MLTQKLVESLVIGVYIHARIIIQSIDGSMVQCHVHVQERASPLMIASQLGHLAIVKLLVAAQADVNAQNRPQGVTALHLAVATGQTEIVSVLLKNGADPKVTDKVNASLQQL